MNPLYACWSLPDSFPPSRFDREGEINRAVIALMRWKNVREVHTGKPAGWVQVDVTNDPTPLALALFDAKLQRFLRRIGAA